MSSLKLLLDRSNKPKVHVFPNDFGIPPSKEFDPIETTIWCLQVFFYFTDFLKDPIFLKMGILKG